MNFQDELSTIMNPVKQKVQETLTLTEFRDGIQQELMSKVRLNRYDMKFMINIQDNYLRRNKPLSQGQNELYEKIVHKYRKQLRKLKVNYKDVIALPWKNGLVTLETLKQKTFFRVDDGKMQFYFNFNKRQIDEVRALVHDDAGRYLNANASRNFGNGQKYDFNWSNNTKIWSGPFHTYLFKDIYNFATSINVKIDQSVMDIVAQLDANGSKEDWTPSIKIVNDRIYINHIAETMLPFLDDISPTDLSIANIERLVKFGLVAPAKYAMYAEYINDPAGTTEHELTTIDDVNSLNQYLNASGRKAVFYVPEIRTSRNERLQPVLNALDSCEDWDNGAKLYEMRRSTPAERAEDLDKLRNRGYNTLVTTTSPTTLLRSQEEIGKFAVSADKIIKIKIKDSDDSNHNN